MPLACRTNYRQDLKRRAYLPVFMANFSMEEKKTSKTGKLRGFAVIVGGVVLFLSLVANVAPAASVIANFDKAPALASGFLAGFAVLVGLPILAILWGLGKIGRKAEVPA